MYVYSRFPPQQLQNCLIYGIETDKNNKLIEKSQYIYMFKVKNIKNYNMIGKNNQVGLIIQFYSKYQDKKYIFNHVPIEFVAENDKEGKYIISLYRDINSKFMIENMVEAYLNINYIIYDSFKVYQLE